MILAANALVSARYCMSCLNADQHDPADYIPYINMASDHIAAYCRRPFIRSTQTRTLDSCGVASLIFPGRAVRVISQVLYDPARVFDNPNNSQVIPFTFLKGKLYLQKEYPVAEQVFRVTSTEGYDRVDFRGQIAPLSPEVGETWLNGSNVLLQWNGTAWAAFDGIRVPDVVEMACCEYVSWLKVKMRAGGVGVVSKERGYAYEGSAVVYERNMPTHVKDILSEEVVYG